MEKENETITHDFPAWRDQADFVLAARLNEPDMPAKYKWEQIWARQLEDNLFEVCCIPFFTYGLALGDFVSVATLEGKEYVINGLEKSGGQKTYRLWFLDISNWGSIIDEIRGFGCLAEVRWEKSKLISASAPSLETSSLLESYLNDLTSKEEITWEHGN